MICIRFIGVVAVVLATLTGCGRSGPRPIYAVSGKVTLKGKAYKDLRVHFLSRSQDPERFVMGVGQTDEAGSYSVESALGSGLPAGDYVVKFSYMVNAAGKSALGSDKDEGSGRGVVEWVAPPYDMDPGSESPSRFTVSSGGDNRYDFDIPMQRKVDVK